MRTLLLLIIAALLAGCAGAQLKSDWKNKRGYSDQDIDAIMAQYSEYSSDKARATVNSNAFNSAPYEEHRSRMKSIFCACAKKLGDKCREKPDGLSGKDKSLWIKANAVDMDMIGSNASFETNGMSLIDTVECQ